MTFHQWFVRRSSSLPFGGVGANGDGKVNATDLTALGVASNIVTRTFEINP